MLVSGTQQSDSIICIYTHKYTTHTHTHTYIYLDSFPLKVNTDIEYRSLCYIVGPCCFSSSCRIVSNLLLSQTMVHYLHLSRHLCTCVFIRKMAVSGFIGSRDMSTPCPAVQKEIFRCEHAAAAAKLLQSCPTLCDPIDSSPPGSSVHGIFQAKVLEWGAIAFSEM